MSQAAAHLQGHGVVQAMNGCVQKCEVVVQNADKAKDVLLETADVFITERDGSADKDDSKVQRVRQGLLALVQLKHEIGLYQKALRNLTSSYAASMEATDFKASLERDVQQESQAGNFNPERDPAVKDFDESAGLQEAAGAASEEEGDDELRIVGGQAVHKNEKCPYTGKLLLDLEDPVEDQMGFVYERAPLIADINRHQGRLVSPFAGTSHRITVNDLKVSKATKREQKKARLAAAAGGAGGGRGRGRGNEVVLDA